MALKAARLELARLDSQLAAQFTTRFATRLNSRPDSIYGSTWLAISLRGPDAARALRTATEADENRGRKWCRQCAALLQRDGRSNEEEGDLVRRQRLDMSKHDQTRSEGGRRHSAEGRDSRRSMERVRRRGKGSETCADEGCNCLCS